jgi:3-hydroxyisobutyrate dehydrogenase-like beta-hydroxyacid dehydrogenase
MSKNLVQKGNLEKPLILWNRTQSRATSLSENIGHSIVAETFQDAVSRSDIIFSCISDEQGVRTIIDTILKGDLKGKLSVECSTVKPEYIDALVTDVRAAGAELIAMPGMFITRLTE